MKFVKSLLAVSILSVSAGAMAASTGNPTADNNAFNAITDKHEIDAKIVKLEGGNIAITNEAGDNYLLTNWDAEQKAIVKNDDNVTEANRAIVEAVETYVGKTPVGINPPVMPTPIVNDLELKRGLINHLVKHETRSTEVMVGGESMTISNVSINKDGTINYSVERSDGTTTNMTSQYVMDGSHKDEIIEGAKKQFVGVDPVVGINPIKEQPHVDAIKAYVADHGEAARQATTDLDSRIAANDSRIGKNADAIDFNRQAINSLQEEVNRLDDKMDGVMASTHAVTNARPFLTGSGQTAVGVGTGFAGDSQAVAIGVAHSFNTNWSASMSVNATTGSDSDFSAGAGVQYVF